LELENQVTHNSKVVRQVEDLAERLTENIRKKDEELQKKLLKLKNDHREELD
jgi:uncharacterized protein with NRDE domain